MNEFNRPNCQFELPRDVREHGNRVGIVAFNISSILGLGAAFCRDSLFAGIHHDDGKALIPLPVLNKPMTLTDKEFAIIKGHAFYSYKLAQAVAYLQPVAKSILFHHERMDGSGYYNMTGESIPMLSRILAVADVYDALTSDRIYRSAYTSHEALEMMAADHDLYDSTVYAALVDSIADINTSFETVSDLVNVV